MMDWRFASAEGCQFNGIGDSGIEEFKGSPMLSLAREICQNSIDARPKDCEGNLINPDVPVKVEFKVFDLPVEQIPGKETLKNVFDDAYGFCKSQKFIKATKFFEKSIPLFLNDTIPVLRISDFNTTGLTGSLSANDNFNTPWSKLIRSAGSSDKGSGSIGSYGIGKFAAFACSSLQTAYYSTFDIEGQCAHEGVARLICYRDEDNELRQNVGYYAEDKSASPNTDMQLSLDSGFERNTPGTDIYVLGFKFYDRDWKREMTASVIDGFFYAIHKGVLVVEVDDILIDAEHLPDLINEYKIYFDNNKSKYKELRDKSYNYHKVLTSAPETKSKFFSMFEPDDVEVQLLIGPNLHRKVAMIRWPGMKIWDKGGISGTVSFAGVLIMHGKKVNEYFGKLENPQHTQWDVSRLEDENEERKAENNKRKLSNFISGFFNEVHADNTEEEYDPGTGDCFADPLAENKKEQQTLTPEFTFKDVKNQPRKPQPDIDMVDDSGEETTSGGGHERTDRPIDPWPHPPVPGPVPGPLPGPADNIIHVRKVGVFKRRVLATDPQKGKYRILFTPSMDIDNGFVRVFLSAESQDYDAPILSAWVDSKKVQTKENLIYVNEMKANVQYVIDMLIDYYDICSMEVKAYANEV